jgi:plasmid stability protein
MNQLFMDAWTARHFPSMGQISLHRLQSLITMQSMIAIQEENMASLTIRNLDNNVKAQLRQRAARHGRSMEAEARTILAQTLNVPVMEQNLAVAIHRRFESLDIESLPIPPRQAVRNPPEFGE